MKRGLEYGDVPAMRIIEAVNKAFCLTWPWVFPGPNEHSPLSPLLAYWDGSDLRKMLTRKHGWIDFNLADQILCALHLSYLWWSELSDLYYAVNLSRTRTKMQARKQRAPRVAYA